MGLTARTRFIITQKYIQCKIKLYLNVFKNILLPYIKLLFEI